MMHLFASGELVRAPERRTTKTGNDYATALLRVDSDTLVNVVVFDNDLAEQLLVLSKGDPLSVSGRLQVSVYDAKDGETRCGLSVTVTQMMASPARASEAKPRARPKPGVPTRSPTSPESPTVDFDDEIGF
jgi:single-stranded DNA-binding protein